MEMAPDVRAAVTFSLKQRVASSLGPRKSAWLMWALGTFLKMGSSPGQTPVIGVFIEFVIDDLKLSRTMISSLYLVATCISSATVPFVGRAIDTHGLGSVSLVVCIGLAATCFYMGFVASVVVPWTLLIGFYLLRFFGQGSMSLVGSNLINQWWCKRRGYMQVTRKLFPTLSEFVC